MRIAEKIKKKMTGPKHVAQVFQKILKVQTPEDRDREHFWVMGLTTKNSVKYIELVSLGGLNSSPVHSREVYRLAVMKSAFGVISCHNHPSGDPTPSGEDTQVTKKLAEAGRILGIELLDHVVIANGEKKYCSMKEMGIL